MNRKAIQRHKTHRHLFFLWTASALLFLLLSSSAGAVGLIDENLKLRVPWLSHEGKLFSVELQYEPATGQFSLLGAPERFPEQEPDSASTVLLNPDLSFTVPRVGYGGELYTLELEKSAGDGELLFDIKTATPVVPPASRGDISSVTLLATRTVDEIKQTLTAQSPLLAVMIPVSHGVSFYRVVYETVDPQGQVIQASGLLAVPLDSDSPLPLLSYQHGTLMRRSDAPSAVETDLFAMIGAASGYVTVAADYLGFGESPGLHPYVHDKSLASAVIDMLRASRTYCAENGISLNDRLFLAGYSEGGYATMAAHKEMETHYPEEFNITASAPMAGPYDLSGVMLEQMTSEEPVPNPYYLAYLLMAYDDVYGLADGPDELMRPEYAETIPPLFDGEHGGSEVNAAMPGQQLDFLPEALVSGLKEASPTPLGTALRENDVYRWVPRSPMRLYHCTGDKSVPYGNSETAYNYFSENGSTSVELVPLAFGDHGDCILPAVAQAKTWFDSFQD